MFDRFRTPIVSRIAWLVAAVALLAAAVLTLFIPPSAWASGPVTGPYKIVVIQVTYTDDTTRADTLDNLNLAAGEVHDYFSKLSYGALDAQLTMVQVALTQPKSHYWTACPSADDAGKMCLTGDLAGDAAEIAGAAGTSFAGVKALSILSPCNTYPAYDNFTAGGDTVLNSAHAHATVHQVFDTECAHVASTEFLPLGPSNVDWHAWAHELGHTIQKDGGNMFSHPGGYSSGYDLMDSCYPCGETVYSLSGSPVVANEHNTSFPGWLPASKTVVIDRPASGSAGGTYVLEPVAKPDPSATVAPRGIKLPLDGGRAIFIEARTNTGADARSYGMFDEGVHMYLAQEGAIVDGWPKPLTMLDACATTEPGGCITDGNTDPRASSCPSVAHLSASHGYCWPYNLWHVGDTFNDPIDGIIMHVNGTVGDGYGVTVTRNVPPGRPDVFLYPWLTAPMNTYETVDIWVDSSCNGYEADVGPDGLRYGRRPDHTVVGNGDDPCANHENRIYAHIRNGGSLAANNVVVHFQVTSPLGVGDSGAWTDAGSFTIPSLAAGAEQDVFVAWTPSVTLTAAQIASGHFNFHSCVKIVIDPPSGDLVTSNKTAQENFDNFEAVRDRVTHSYTIPDHRFYVANNYGLMRHNMNSLTAASMGKVPADFSKPIQLSIDSDMPAGWVYEVNGGANEFTLAPHEVRQVPVVIKVPDGTPTAQTFSLRVTAYAQHHMINPVLPASDPRRWHFGWMAENGVVEGVLTVDPSKLDIEGEYKCPPPATVAVFPGTLRIKGHLDPEIATIVTLDYSPTLGGAMVSHQVHTNAAGLFTDTLPVGTGIYQVRAIWQGNLAFSSSVSNTLKLDASPKRCVPTPPKPAKLPDNIRVLPVPKVLDGKALPPLKKVAPKVPPASSSASKS